MKRTILALALLPTAFAGVCSAGTSCDVKYGQWQTSVEAKGTTEVSIPKAPFFVQILEQYKHVQVSVYRFGEKEPMICAMGDVSTSRTSTLSVLLESRDLGLSVKCKRLSF